jgi:hypothetical protein
LARHLSERGELTRHHKRKRGGKKNQRTNPKEREKKDPVAPTAPYAKRLLFRKLGCIDGYPQRDKRLHLLRKGREMVHAVRKILQFTEMAIDPDCWPAESTWHVERSGS